MVRYYPRNVSKSVYGKISHRIIQQQKRLRKIKILSSVHHKILHTVKYPNINGFHTMTCLYNSIASNKAFIGWGLWVQAWFRGQSIITFSQERPSSNSGHHQTLLVWRHSVGLPYPRWVRCPVGWSCRIHRQLLCRGVRTPSQRVSRIWHKTI